MDELNERTFFRVVDGTIPQFAFFEENINPDSDETHMSHTLSFSCIQKRRVVNVAAGVTLEQGRGPVAKCVVELEFNIRNDSFVNLIKDNSIVIPKELLIYFGSKAIGTLRGVMLAKLENTPINIILPLVNLEEMIKEPLVAEIL